MKNRVRGIDSVISGSSNEKLKNGWKIYTQRDREREREIKRERIRER